MNEKEILNRIRKFCAALGLMSVLVLMIAYFKGMTNLGVFVCGVILATALVETISNPIINEEDEEDG